MGSIIPNKDYISAAENLTDEEIDNLLCRMRCKQMINAKREKFVTLEDLASQLESEDADLADWRKHLSEIKESEGFGDSSLTMVGSQVKS